MGVVSAVAPSITSVSGDGGIGLIPDKQHWNDAVLYVSTGTSIRKNSQARLRLTTSATGIFVSYSVSGSTASSGQGVSVLSNGALAGYITPPGDVGVEHTSYVALPSGSNKTIDVIEGGQVATDVTMATVAACNVTRMTLADGASSLSVKTTPSRRLVVYGDSIAAGFFSTQSSNKSWAAIIRSIYPGQVALDAVGARSLFYDTVTVGNAAVVSQLSSELDGSSYNELWMAMGYNDYGSALQTAANFQARLGALIDAIHAARPDIKRIFVQTLIPTANDGVANGLGNVPADFRAAAAAVAGTRAYATLVDGTTLVTVGQLVDGVHPNDTGEAGYATNVRSVLGI